MCASNADQRIASSSGCAWTWSNQTRVLCVSGPGCMPSSSRARGEAYIWSGDRVQSQMPTSAPTTASEKRSRAVSSDWRVASSRSSWRVASASSAAARPASASVRAAELRASSRQFASAAALSRGPVPDRGKQPRAREAALRLIRRATDRRLRGSDVALDQA